jgi:nucleolar pre-ribosomal-associated protein 2
LDAIGRCTRNESEENKNFKGAKYHGREEWLLKWLLKRLYAAADVEPRYASLSYCELSI